MPLDGPYHKATQSGSTSNLNCMLDKCTDKTTLIWILFHNGIAGNKEQEICATHATTIPEVATYPVAFVEECTLMRRTLILPNSHRKTKEVYIGMAAFELVIPRTTFLNFERIAFMVLSKTPSLAHVAIFFILKCNIATRLPFSSDKELIFSLLLRTTRAL